jgi:hypothetical protein
VLTAAHCVFHHKGIRGKFAYSPEKLQVRVGDYKSDHTGRHEKVYKVAKVIPHEDFQYVGPVPKNDVAVLELKEKVELEKGVIETISLSQNEDFYAEGTTVTAIGWGYTENSYKAASTLQEVEKRIGNQETCRRNGRYKPAEPFEASLGAIDPYHKAAVLHGDSGGPLFVKSADQKFTQVGLVSWGHPREAHQCSWFTNVLYYLKWIEKVAEPMRAHTDLPWLEIAQFVPKMKNNFLEVTCVIEPRKDGTKLPEYFFLAQLVELLVVPNRPSGKAEKFEMTLKEHNKSRYTWEFKGNSVRFAEDSCYACSVSVHPYLIYLRTGHRPPDYLRTKAIHDPERCQAYF